MMMLLQYYLALFETQQQAKQHDTFDIVTSSESPSTAQILYGAEIVRALLSRNRILFKFFSTFSVPRRRPLPHFIAHKEFVNWPKESTHGNQSTPPRTTPRDSKDTAVQNHALCIYLLKRGKNLISERAAENFWI
jgi:hypothetical protein